MSTWAEAQRSENWDGGRKGVGERTPALKGLKEGCIWDKGILEIIELLTLSIKSVSNRMNEWLSARETKGSFLSVLQLGERIYNTEHTAAAQTTVKPQSTSFMQQSPNHRLWLGQCYLKYLNISKLIHTIVHLKCHGVELFDKCFVNKNMFEWLSTSLRQINEMVFKQEILLPLTENVKRKRECPF